MTTYGPFYPAGLQRAVNHAERLGQLLSVRLSRALVDEWAAAWMLGREEEIERFVELVVGDWKRGSFGDAQATAVLNSYLVTLHEGLSKHLRLSSSPCCVEPPAATSLPPRSDAVTRELPIHRPAHGPRTSTDSVQILLDNVFAEPDGSAFEQHATPPAPERTDALRIGRSG